MNKSDRKNTQMNKKILMCPKNIAHMLEAKEKELSKRTENQYKHPISPVRSTHATTQHYC